MKPKPFSALNHLTVPFAMLKPFLLATDLQSVRESNLAASTSRTNLETAFVA